MNIEEKIGLYVEGELSSEEQEKVALLIASDEDYKMAYTTYLAIISVFSVCQKHYAPHFPYFNTQ